MENEREIHALIQLLEDNDVEVIKHVYAKLKSFGTAVIPILEQSWYADIDPIAHERLEDIIKEIKFDELVQEWKIWVTKEVPDLLTGAYLVAKYYYPEINFEAIEKKIAKFKQAIWLELNYNQTPLEQVQIFNQIFYHYHAFKGVQDSLDYTDFCINNVLESRTGNAISMGIIYQVLANELNLPVYGVNLTNHYILAFCKRMIYDFDVDTNLEREVMFYINPVNVGSIFSRNEIKDYLEKMNEEAIPKYFIPCNNLGIIKEMLTYLIALHAHKQELQNADELSYLKEL